ncbi:MAG: hypothetical protein M3342_01920 [Bacteroidota bacterium]|nr:hypothetical protein [Flavisolibacter sp.]MBD0288801.1 hypothetical protein [Flavisolibacter sp.]MBD0295088.1 hypothetical protein [Flavisolibacter sp.]MBD0377311.1 hypothetical protein [Flavisolibacter sp.]MDQ3842759.1 hypothetical protein [Bacteroidota bacterium]
MKTTLLAAALFIAVTGCNNNSNTDVGTADTSDVKHPDGTINSSPISTDTSAYKVNTPGKAAKDSVRKK